MQNRVYTNVYSNISFAVLSPHSLLHDARVSLKASRVYPLHDWVKQQVVEYFIRYLDVSKARVIVLEDEDDYCTIPYKTRFHSVDSILRNFNEVFDLASRSNREGVWLVITTNPAKFERMDYLSYRYEFMRSWNRALAWFRKKFKRVSYIAVFEFTDSGLLHIHVIFFGLKRIEDAYKFMKRLEDWGFGRVHYMVSVVNENGVWRPKVLSKYYHKIDNCDGAGLPKDFLLASRMGLKNYLKKYLTKTLKAMEKINSILNSSSGTLDDVIIRVFQTKSNNRISQNRETSSKDGVVAGSTSTNTSNIATALWKLAMYWALRLRFFTYSRDLGVVSRKRIRLLRYHFVGVFSIEHYVVYNGYYHDWLENPDFLCFDVMSITELMF
jgi:hypothetical protein